MSSVSVVWEGLDEIAHLLSGLESPQLDKITRQGTLAAGKVFAAAMKPLIPVTDTHHRTRGGEIRPAGALRKSVKVRRIRNGSVGHVAGPMGKWARMRAPLDHGHRIRRSKNGPVLGRVPAHPFTDPAMAAEDAAFAAAERAIFAAIDKL